MHNYLTPAASPNFLSLSIWASVISQASLVFDSKHFFIFDWPQMTLRESLLMKLTAVIVSTTFHHRSLLTRLLILLRLRSWPLRFLAKFLIHGCVRHWLALMRPLNKILNLYWQSKLLPRSGDNIVVSNSNAVGQHYIGATKRIYILDGCAIAIFNHLNWNWLKSCGLTLFDKRLNVKWNLCNLLTHAWTHHRIPNHLLECYS